MIAAQEGHSEAVEALLEGGAAINLANIKGSTALHLAANNGHEDCVRVILEARADPGLVDVVEHFEIFFTKY